jgi:hypothetical protein
VGAYWVEYNIYEHLPKPELQEIYKKRNVTEDTLEDIFYDIQYHERFTALQLYCSSKAFNWIKNLTFISGLRYYEIFPRTYESCDLFGKFGGLSLDMYYNDNCEPRCAGYFYSDNDGARTAVVYNGIIYVGNKKYNSSEYFINDIEHDFNISCNKCWNSIPEELKHFFLVNVKNDNGLKIISGRLSNYCKDLLEYNF